MEKAVQDREGTGEGEGVGGEEGAGMNINNWVRVFGAKYLGWELAWIEFGYDWYLRRLYTTSSGRKYCYCYGIRPLADLRWRIY